jgi:hypothetical protein
MKIAEVRRAIEALDAQRRALSEVPTEEFISMDIDNRLQPRIAELAAVNLGARYPTESRLRDATVDNANDLVLRWREARGACARVRKLGCCGR